MVRGTSLPSTSVTVNSTHRWPRIRVSPTWRACPSVTGLSLDPFDILVADLSFISLTVAMPAMARAVTPEGEVVLLVKPQFEVGRERLGKNGIVSRSRDRALAIGRVVDSAAEYGLGVQGLLPSPISGTHGNREFLLWLRPADGSDMDPSVLTRTIEVGAVLSASLRTRTGQDRRRRSMDQRRILLLVHPTRRDAQELADVVAKRLLAAGVQPAALAAWTCTVRRWGTVMPS